jgi:hypothetical protein
MINPTPKYSGEIYQNLEAMLLFSLLRHFGKSGFHKEP